MHGGGWRFNEVGGWTDDNVADGRGVDTEIRINTHDTEPKRDSRQKMRFITHEMFRVER